MSENTLKISSLSYQIIVKTIQTLVAKLQPLSTFTKVIQKVLRVSNKKKENELFKIVCTLNGQNNPIDF
jgi:hypothetical protein